MSVEALVLAALVEDGTPKKAFQVGIGSEDFDLYDEEFKWICEQAERRNAINARRFRERFEDFEWITTKDTLEELLGEFKNERAYISLSAALDQIISQLSPDNAIEQAELIREIAGDILRAHSPGGDVNLAAGYQNHLTHQRMLYDLHERGKTYGIPTGIPNLDHHWGGLVAGRMILVLGRPGDGKSFLNAKLFTEAFISGEKVGMFSPEMNEHEHYCRVGTLLSANKQIQEWTGLTQAFRNRPLMEGHGFPVKRYKSFWRFLNDEMPGSMHLLTRTYRRSKMTPAFIESKVEELGLGCVIVDPIYKLKSPVRRGTKWEEIQELTDSLQEIAEAHQIPVVISNQAHRQMNNKGDAPHKDASFGSDAPAMEADHVIGVKHDQDDGLLILRCTKNRFGSDFRIELDFNPNIGRMIDITPLRGNYFNGNRDDHDHDMLKKMKEEIDQEE